MASDKLNIYKKPRLDTPRILLGFSGWMDGGKVLYIKLPRLYGGNRTI
jgi:hypothetical protein